MVVVFLRLVLLKEGMSAFVDDGVHAGDELIRVVVGGYAGIVSGHELGKGVLGGGEGAAVEVKLHLLEKQAGHPGLLFVFYSAVQEVGADFPRTFFDFFQERDEALFAGAEGFIKKSRGHSLLIVVQEAVVGGIARGVCAPKLYHLLIDFHDFFQIGGKDAVIGGFSRFAPFDKGPVEDAGEFVLKLRRDVSGLQIGSVQKLSHRGIEWFQLPAVFVQFFGCFDECRVFDEFVGLVAEEGHDVALPFHGGCGADGLLVIHQDSCGVVVLFGLGKNLLYMVQLAAQTGGLV